MSNFKLEQKDKFELGTYTNFISIAFLFIAPVIIKYMNIYVDNFWFQAGGLVFIFMTGIFYALSPQFFKYQLIVIGINFLTFAIFQYISHLEPTKSLLATIIAITLVITGLWPSSRKV